MQLDRMLSMRDRAGLKEEIGRSAAQKLTPEEVLAQRVSFVYASVSEKGGVTKDQIRSFLAGQKAPGVGA